MIACSGKMREDGICGRRGCLSGPVPCHCEIGIRIDEVELYQPTGSRTDLRKDVWHRVSTRLHALGFEPYGFGDGIADLGA